MCISPTRVDYSGVVVETQVPSVREIDTVEITTTGNATDFGNLTGSVTAAGAACSNGHGGL